MAKGRVAPPAVATALAQRSKLGGMHNFAGFVRIVAAGIDDALRTVLQHAGHHLHLVSRNANDHIGVAASAGRNHHPSSAVQRERTTLHVEPNTLHAQCARQLVRKWITKVQRCRERWFILGKSLLGNTRFHSVRYLWKHALIDGDELSCMIDRSHRITCSKVVLQ